MCNFYDATAMSKPINETGGYIKKIYMWRGSQI